MLQLGAELRMGQIHKLYRSDLDIERGSFRVPDCGRKKGEAIFLTDGQQIAVQNALQGYLAKLEARWLAGEVDYPLFPGDVLPSGGVFALVGFDGQLHRPCHKQSIYDWTRRTEKSAGIPHIKGRCAYGLRRAGRMRGRNLEAA